MDKDRKNLTNPPPVGRSSKISHRKKFHPRKKVQDDRKKDSSSGKESTTSSPELPHPTGRAWKEPFRPNRQDHHQKEATSSALPPQQRTVVSNESPEPGPTTSTQTNATPKLGFPPRKDNRVTAWDVHTLRGNRTNWP